MNKPKQPAIKQVNDVARPGSTAPALNSKSVIVNNRPILKDPMMADEQSFTIDSAVPSAPPLAKSKTKAKTASTNVSKEASASLTKAVETESVAEPITVKVTTRKPADTETIDQIVQSAPEVAAPLPEQQPARPMTTERAPDKASTPSSTSKKLSTKEADDKSSELVPENELDEDSVDDTAVRPHPTDEANAKVAAQAAHETAVQALIDSKQFVLPINAVEKRRTQRFVVAGIILSLLLAVAWADVALDAGLIHLGNIRPVTHFFSN